MTLSSLLLSSWLLFLLAVIVVVWPQPGEAFASGWSMRLLPRMRHEPPAIAEHRYYMDYESIAMTRAHRYIHSLELLEGLRGNDGARFLELGPTSLPYQAGRLSCVDVNATFRGTVPVTLRVFTDRIHRAHVLCLYKGRPLAYYRVSVCGAEHGHRMSLRIRYFRTPRLLGRATQPLRFFLMFFEVCTIYYHYYYDDDDGLSMRRTSCCGIARGCGTSRTSSFIARSSACWSRSRRPFFSVRAGA